ncbi:MULTISPECIES: N-acetylmuramoyl-L-alanine amidase-like domain-containing protein [unclassified Providencia]|uniref:N-acetylmuramoyl-L-alanine amidase-like domain-containing protein n=1 Tax=unclassified Providencia TaxID=2633465 RepID=UPI00234A2A8A|nr:MULTISPECIES: N-acetylmuramoyl-L-alanine amidase-like domain-containing protein [unclassified Providencia]
MLRLVIAAFILLLANFVRAEVILASGSYKILTEVFNEQTAMQLQNASQAEKIDVLTRYFLTTPYNKQTLNMSPLSPEELVINLKEMDCMTFIEYIEAFKRSNNYEQFVSNLINIRYINQNITFKHRRHFFSDWAQEPEAIVVDITSEISPHAIQVKKQLNLKNYNQRYISDLPVKGRLINYIPVKYVDDDLVLRLNTGDYIGVYSKDNGLDVSHVGVVIRRGNKTIFRNASSLRRNLQVIDIELNDYLKGKAGIVVFRPKSDY